MSTIPDSQLIHTIAQDGPLRQRIEGLVRQRMQTVTLTATERAMLVSLPLDQLAWVIATNATILSTVRAALTDGAIATAVAAIPDGDLTWAITSEITTLAD